jgi:hypothetical protein
MLLLVFLLSLGLGLAINMLKEERSVRALSGDEPEYHALAVRLIESGQFGLPGGWAHRTPGFPVILAAAYRIGGAGIPTARVLESVLAALMATVAVAMAGMLGGKAACALAGIMVVVESYWWLNQWSIVQENALGVSLSALALLCLLLGNETNGPRRRVLAVLAGFAFGLSLLIKPLLIPLLPLSWLIPLWIRGAARRTACCLVFLATFSCLLTVSPWLLRCWHLFGSPVAFTTDTGRVFQGAHCQESFASPRTWGTWVPVDDSEELRLLQGATAMPPIDLELRVNRARWKAGIDGLRQRTPFEIARLVVFKALRTWSTSTFFSGASPTLKAIKIVLIAVNSSILFGFLAWIWQRRRGWWIGLLMALALTGTTAVFWGSIRLRYPLQPVIAALSAAWWGRLLCRNRRESSRMGPAIAL